MNGMYGTTGGGFPLVEASLMLGAAAASAIHEGQEMALASGAVPSLAPTTQLVSDLGAMTAFFVVALAFMAYYLFVLYPQERKYQREQQSIMSEQVALSRMALETSNAVIGLNSDEMRENRHSHTRIGERLECVENVLQRHDERAEKIGQDTAILVANWKRVNGE